MAHANERSRLLPSSTTTVATTTRLNDEVEDDDDEDYGYYYEESFLSKCGRICSFLVFGNDTNKQCPWCTFISWSLLALLFVIWGLMDLHHFYMSKPLQQDTPLQTAYRVECHHSDWTLRSNYSVTILNKTNGRELYHVMETHQRHDWGLRLSFRDVATGIELASIVQTMGDSFHFGRYEIERESTLWAQVTADGSPFNETLHWGENKLWVDVLPGEEDYRVVGQDLFGWELKVETIQVSSDPTTQTKQLHYSLAGTIDQERGDTYTVLVEPGADDIAILLLAIIIDLVQ